MGFHVRPGTESGSLGASMPAEHLNLTRPAEGGTGRVASSSWPPITAYESRALPLCLEGPSSHPL